MNRSSRERMRSRPRAPRRHSGAREAADGAAARTPGTAALDAGHIRADELLRLQQQAGNQAVTGWIDTTRGATAPITVQALVAEPARGASPVEVLEATMSAEHAAAMKKLDSKEARGKEDPGEWLKEGAGSRGQQKTWLDFMRPYFGSDKATIAHFSKIRQVEGQHNLMLHDDLATKLEAVQDRMGPGNYPQSTAGASHRSGYGGGGKMGHKHMHKIGGAVDFDPYNLPFLTDPRTEYLIALVAKRAQHIDLSEWGSREERGALLTKMAAGPAKGASAEEKKAFEARRQKFLDKVDSEMDAMSAASSQVQASLDKTGGAEAFNKLRADFRAAQAALKANPKDAAAKAAITAVMTGVKKMLKPWLDAIDDECAIQLGLLNGVGADPEAAPAASP
jgi:hypothetical protein